MDRNFEAWKETQRLLAEFMPYSATYDDCHARNALIDAATSFGGYIIPDAIRAIEKAAA